MQLAELTLLKMLKTNFQQAFVNLYTSVYLHLEQAFAGRNKNVPKFIPPTQDT